MKSYPSHRTMMTRRKIILTTSLVLLFTTTASIYSETLLLAWQKCSASYSLRDLFRSEDPKNYVDKKKILFWSKTYGDGVSSTGVENRFEDCTTYKNCFATDWRRMINETDYQAILFSSKDLTRYDLPERRDPKQIYVLVDIEGLDVDRPDASDFIFQGNFFNLTMTYRLDSDVPWPYGLIRNIDGDRDVVAPSRNVEWTETSLDLLRRKLDTKVDNKKKIATSLVSDCQTLGKRESFVEELSKHVDVDLIGHCAGWGAPRCSLSKDCFADIVEPNYYFYLAFEKMLCDDYVTEKFYNSLRYDIIPVVYGGANYSFFAPPHSYIDALDFESPKALATYLIELSKDRDEYLKYFWWKRFYTVDYVTSHVMCRLCEALNEPRPTKTYSPFHDWFSKDKCPMHDILKNKTYATKITRDRAIEKQRKN